MKTKIEEGSSQVLLFQKKLGKMVKKFDKNLKMLEAKSTKLENWKVHKSYEELNGIGENNTSVRWIITQNIKEEKLN